MSRVIWPSSDFCVDVIRRHGPEARVHGFPSGVLSVRAASPDIEIPNRAALDILLERAKVCEKMMEPEPPPAPSTGDVWAECITMERDDRLRALMVARRELGLSRYGTVLQRDNGRDALADAFEEILDCLVYLRSGKQHAHYLAVRDVGVRLLDENPRLCTLFDNKG